MSSKFSTSFVREKHLVDVEIMESILKDLYKKVEEKLSCACLIHKDMKIMVMNYIMEQKPYLSKIGAERKAEVVLKNCYEEYKNERDKKLNVFRRSFRKVTKKEPSCKCHKNTIHRSSSKAKLTKNSQSYEKLDGTDEGCRCHITCAQQDIANILEPLEKFMTTNRSFKLRLKHLDREKYGHLDTDSSVRSAVSADTVIDSHRARSATSSNCFALKVENTSTPSSKLPQYKFRFGRKPPTPSEESTKRNAKEHIVKRSDSAGSSNVRNQTFAKETQSAEIGDTDEDERVVIKMTHCDNHCFLCMLEKGVKKDPQLVCCKGHCPKCVPSQMEVIANNSLAISNIVTAKLSACASNKPKSRSKSETRVASKLESARVSTNLSARLDKNMPKRINGKQGRMLNSGNKENVSRRAAEDEITVVKDDTEESNLNDCLEWDSLGLDEEQQWGNTLTALDDIKKNHVRPIRKEISDMQQHFRSLLSKYNLQ